MGAYLFQHVDVDQLFYYLGGVVGDGEGLVDGEFLDFVYGEEGAEHLLVGVFTVLYLFAV